MNMHHIIVDGWSLSLLVRDFTTRYAAWQTGRPSPISRMDLGPVDIAVHQRELMAGGVQAHLLPFWKQQLQGLSGLLELPPDHPHARRSGHGADLPVRIGSELLAGLKRLAADSGTTLFMVLQSLFALLLFRYSGQERFVTGTPIAGRGIRETEEIVGFFVNMLVLVCDFAGRPSFPEFLTRMRATVLDAFDHQDLPFELLVERLQPRRHGDAPPLVQVLFALQNAPTETMCLEAVEIAPVRSETTNTRLDLELHLWEGATELTGFLIYDRDRFEPVRMQQFLEHFTLLAEQVVQNPDRSCDSLKLLSPAHEAALLPIRGEVAPDSDEPTLYELFLQQIAAEPGALAVKEPGGRSLDRGTLMHRAEQVAAALEAIGGDHRTPVAVCLEPGLMMIASLLGILRGGRAWVALDPAHPKTRLRFMLEDSGATILLSDNLSGSAIAPDHVTVLDPTSPAFHDVRYTVPPMSAQYPDAPAYVIYTSGSTGRPKGVVGTHRATVNRLRWMWRTWPFAEDERCCHKTTLAFVDAIWEIFGPLLGGVPLVLFGSDTTRDPRVLYDLIERERITRLVLVPSLMDALLTHGLPPSVRVWSLSGETFTGSLHHRLYQRLATMNNAPTVLNLYGSSEVTADVTCHTVQPDDGPVPIGLPITGIRLYVLDRFMQPVPPGIPGMLFVGGVGLAQGYLNAPDQTAARFVPDPFATEDRVGDRLYRTGDRVVIPPCNAVHCPPLHYLGREDQQLKIRGARIEPAEIEARLREVTGVTAAVVLPDPEDQTRLLAYVAGTQHTPETLRGHLAAAFTRLHAAGHDLLPGDLASDAWW